MPDYKTCPECGTELDYVYEPDGKIGYWCKRPSCYYTAVVDPSRITLSKVNKALNDYNVEHSNHGPAAI